MPAAAQIRYHRNLKNISLRSLAKEAGISPSKLSKIESGKAKLTVDLAVKLAGVLHVPAALFLLEGTPKVLGRRTVTKSGSGIIHENPGMRLEVLCSGFKEKNNIFWRATITARTLEENGGMRQHPGQEFLYILSGKMEILSAFYDPLVLEVGDSILFDADQPHAYIALEGRCEIIMMNSVSVGN